jgi:hypothetical protein
VRKSGLVFFLITSLSFSIALIPDSDVKSSVTAGWSYLYGEEEGANLESNPIVEKFEAGPPLSKWNIKFIGVPEDGLHILNQQFPLKLRRIGSHQI